MAPRLILASAIVAILAGCGRHSGTTPSAPAPSAEPGQSAADTPAAEQPRVADASAKVGPAAATVARSDSSGAGLSAALGELTQALRKYSFEHQRVPKTFSEVVSAGYVKNMPQAPPGKRFEIDAKTVQVVLVKQ